MVPVNPIRTNKVEIEEKITVTFHNDEAVVAESESVEINPPDEEEEAVETSIETEIISNQEISSKNLGTNQVKEVVYDENCQYERQYEIELHAENDISYVQLIVNNNDSIDEGNNNEIIDMMIDEDEEELEIVGTMKNVCLICFEIGHKSPICPFRSSENRTAEVRKDILERKAYYKEICPEFFINKRKKKNFSKKNNKRKRREGTDGGVP
ncbi:unnamed protein product [Orchesella dallaii]|uniref:Uncharacterized protein n=1 Tax=Orchesella dallaii TaxID=48710 RepID=A0ABP1R5U1_9HEXA